VDRIDFGSGKPAGLSGFCFFFSARGSSGAGIAATPSGPLIGDAFLVTKPNFRGMGKWEMNHHFDANCRVVKR
jgi:hypothetical protein